jgi:hypothetical protein
MASGDIPGRFDWGDPWMNALAEIAEQVYDIGDEPGIGWEHGPLSDTGESIVLCGRVTVHLIGTVLGDVPRGLRITTVDAVKAEFSGDGAPPPVAAVAALIRALLNDGSKCSQEPA